MSKHLRWISLLLAASFCLPVGTALAETSAPKSSTSKSSASSAKKKIASPSALNKRVQEGFGAFFDDLDNSTFTTDDPEDLKRLESWDGLLEIIYEQSSLVLSQLDDVKQNGGRSFMTKSGNQVETKVTNKSYTYTITGPMNFGSSKKEKLLLAAETAKFSRSTGKVESELYLVGDDDKKGKIYSYFDLVAGENYLFIQLLDYDESLVEEGEKPFWALRVMVGKGNVAASFSNLSEAEAKEARLTKTYKNFTAFAFPKSAKLVYSGDKVTVTLLNGDKIVYNQVAGSDVSGDMIKVE